MLVCMRTTVILPDALYEDVKRLAADTRRTVTEVLADALVQAVDRHRRRGVQVHEPLPTFRGNGLLPGVDIRSNAALRDVLDDRDDVDRRR